RATMSIAPLAGAGWPVPACGWGSREFRDRRVLGEAGPHIRMATEGARSDHPADSSGTSVPAPNAEEARRAVALRQTHPACAKSYSQGRGTGSPDRRLSEKRLLESIEERLCH